MWDISRKMIYPVTRYKQKVASLPTSAGVSEEDIPHFKLLTEI